MVAAPNSLPYLPPESARLCLESIEQQDGAIQIFAHMMGSTASCPAYHQTSSHLHSRYIHLLRTCPGKGRWCVFGCTRGDSIVGLVIAGGRCSPSDRLQSYIAMALKPQKRQSLIEQNQWGELLTCPGLRRSYDYPDGCTQLVPCCLDRTRLRVADSKQCHQVLMLPL